MRHPLAQWKPRRTKYGAKRTTVDGISFHSEAEAARWVALRTLERAGLIRTLQRQVRYRLNAVHVTTKAMTPIGNYVADFTYVDASTGETIVEDVKGMATLPLAKWKQKHLMAEHGIGVVEVR